MGIFDIDINKSIIILMEPQPQKPQNKNAKIVREKQIIITQSEKISNKINGQSSSISKHKNSTHYQKQVLPQLSKISSHKKRRPKSLNPQHEQARLRLLNHIIDKLKDTKQASLGTINITEQNIEQKICKLRVLSGGETPQTQNQTSQKPDKVQSRIAQKIDISHFLKNIKSEGVVGSGMRIQQKNKNLGSDFDHQHHYNFSKTHLNKAPLYNDYASKKNQQKSNFISQSNTQVPNKRTKQETNLNKISQVSDSQNYKYLLANDERNKRYSTMLEAINNRLSTRSRSNTPHVKFTYSSPNTIQIPQNYSVISPEKMVIISPRNISKSNEQNENKLGFNSQKNLPKQKKGNDACPVCGRNCNCQPYK